MKDDLFFNMDHGYAEGLCRGFKSGILKGADYHNLIQCETLEGPIKSSRCFRSFSSSPFRFESSSSIDRLRKFLSQRSESIDSGRDQRSSDGKTRPRISTSTKRFVPTVVDIFGLHYVNVLVFLFRWRAGLFSYGYMIDNIVLLITGTLNQRPIGDLLPRCHPLGTFEQLGGIAVADTPAQLYNAVIVDTPLGKRNAHRRATTRHSFLHVSAPYFIDCISEHDLDELNVEIIRNTLYKVWIFPPRVLLSSFVFSSGVHRRFLQLLQRTRWRHCWSDVWNPRRESTEPNRTFLDDRSSISSKPIAVPFWSRSTPLKPV